MAQSFDTSLRNVAGQYLRLLHTKVTLSSIQTSLEQHAHYPSLLSLSDTFNRYHISNCAIELAPGDLWHLEPPYVAFADVPGVGKDFLLVKDVSDKAVTYLYKNKKSRTVPKEEFLKGYLNVVWAAEPDERSGEADFEKKRKLEDKIRNKRTLWIAGLIALLLIAIAGNMPSDSIFSFGTIVLLKLIGCTAGILLLLYETDNSNAFVKNICSAGGQTDCDAVLGSKASRIMGVSWAEIGFFYFAATTLWLLLPFVPFADKTRLVSISNAFAAPYILFSIYYQWRVVKQWCPLCLTVQGILLSEFMWTILNFWTKDHSLSFIFNPLLVLSFCILLPILLWYGLKPVFTRAKDADLYKFAYKRAQYNADIFSSLLQQQAKAPGGWQHLGISIGNPDASNTIVKVCNPYCGPCAKTHPVLEELAKRNANVQIRVIFTARNDKRDKSSIVVKHLLAIAAEGDPVKTQQSLDDWYMADKKEYDSFAGKYPMNGELEKQDMKIEAMSKWCHDAEVTHTPTIFVNGCRLPENYNVEELQYIL